MVVMPVGPGAIIIPNCPPPRQGQFSTECYDLCAPPGGAGNFLLSLACTCCAFGVMTGNAPPGTVPCAGNCCGGCCFASSCPAFAFCLAKNGLRTAYGMPNGAGELIGDFMCGLLFHGCVTMHLTNEVTIRNNAVALTQGAAMQQQMQMQGALHSQRSAGTG